MKFEVEVNESDRLDTLHEARKRYNAENASKAGFVPCDDMPTYVQRMMDEAVATALATAKVKKK